MTPKQRREFEWVRDNIHGDPAAPSRPEQIVPSVHSNTHQPEQKPVGVVALDTSRPFVGGSYNGQVMPWSQAPKVKTVVMFKDLPLNTPLYDTPPQRTWVGLTDDERRGLREWQEIQEKLGPVWAPMMLYLYEAIEAKLKQKNGFAEEDA